MSFFSWLCGCLTPSTSPLSPPAPGMTTVQPERHSHHRRHEGLENNNLPDHNDPPHFDDGYTPPIPLPRYTPRPMSSIQEKTLEAHMRDPPISSSQPFPSVEDEKNPQEFMDDHDNQEEVTSDVSSAISFPSSYGNTSTATRETPPPPYSPRFSPAPSRCFSPVPSRSMSISSINPPPLPPPPMAHVSQSRPGFQLPEYVPGHFTSLARLSSEDQSSLHQRRFSWESQ